MKSFLSELCLGLSAFTWSISNQFFTWHRKLKQPIRIIPTVLPKQRERTKIADSKHHGIIM